MDNLKLLYELGRLEDLVEERVRLTSVLKIRPSSKDNLNLKRQLDKALDLLHETANNNEENLEKYSKRYSEILLEIPDKVIDLALYEFELPVKGQSPDDDTSDALGSRDLPKKVRFKDENLVSYNESEQFEPYHDEPQPVPKIDAKVEDDRMKLLNRAEPSQAAVTAPALSNQGLFIQQQQQLLEQDTYLDALGESVRKSHDFAMDINDEVTEQNNQVLHDLESLVDNSGRNLDRAKRRLQVFESTARENGPCFIILLLILILLLLLIML
ncbi:hypothetical protein HG536_0F03750 [Torulaspora globosa]|uniref:t-SNARE coiled-coil homology domain-containing protein n=1 Tax=Torulaspora globosa TaxID=48254 RepID=A0A7G3ZKL4_9SACH|nr:uncharacterized protein HG536_0F03750 [Torulaspora globosa]QLL34050.1 hypothetical protein HG536_0F03750 [Torulaspora globosa]